MRASIPKQSTTLVLITFCIPSFFFAYMINVKLIFEASLISQMKVNTSLSPSSNMELII